MHALCLSYMPRTKHAESWSLSHIWIFVRYHLHLTSVGECRKVTPENSVSSTASFLDTLFNASSLPGFFRTKRSKVSYSFREATTKMESCEGLLRSWELTYPPARHFYSFLEGNLVSWRVILFPGG